jgi:hypothetical protein
MGETANNPSGTDAFAELNEFWFKYLLITLVTVFFVIPVISELVIRPFPLIGRILYLVVFLMILAGAVGLSPSGRPAFFLSLLLGVLIMLMNILFLFFRENGLMIAHHLLLIMLLGYFTFALTRYLFLCRSVTRFTIHAALSAYLLLALIWALLYSTVDMLQPGAFSVPIAIDPGGHLSDPGLSVPFPSFYFSIVTITTLGYGDITPVAGAARTLASSEAILGQMFIAITLARLVAIFSSHRKHSIEPSNKD